MRFLSPAESPPPLRTLPPAKTEVAPATMAAPAALPPDRKPERPADRIIRLLGAAPTLTDDLVRESALPASVVLAVLLDLELDGRIERGSGGVVTLLK
jgi:DNA processing protein